MRRSYFDKDPMQLKRELEVGFENDELQDEMAIGEKL